MKHTKLPIFTENCASSLGEGNEMEDLEANGLFTLAHKFGYSPISCRDVIDDGSWDDAIMYCSHLHPVISSATYDNDGEEYGCSAFAPDQAADVVDAALEDTRMVMVTPPPAPYAQVASAKKIRVARSSKQGTSTSKHNRPGKSTRLSKPSSRSSCTLPTTNDPIDENFCMKLHSDSDKGKCNPAHIVIRRDVLEIRRTQSGKIFFQCACCKHLPRSERAKRSILAPQRVGNLYRAMIHFMMDHVPLCEHIPDEIRGLSPKDSRNGNMRGVKSYWAESAIEKGLVDGEDGSSIVLRKSNKTHSY